LGSTRYHISLSIPVVVDNAALKIYHAMRVVLLHDLIEVSINGNSLKATPKGAIHEHCVVLRGI
jgi:hypothetical protein